MLSNFETLHSKERVKKDAILIEPLQVAKHCDRHFLLIYLIEPIPILEPK